MTKTTRTTKKSTAAAEELNKAQAEQPTQARTAGELDPEQSRKDIAAMFAAAAKAARKTH